MTTRLLDAPDYRLVLQFWFEEVDPSQWWQEDADFDQTLGQRFQALHQKASQGELFAWRQTSEGRLAEIIVLDQFSRNLYRGQPRAFAQDGMALALAQEALAHGADRDLSPPQKSFLYLPFMHSESLVIHEFAVSLFQVPGMETNLDFELKHKKIIEAFGRYPHRNAILGRESIPEELAILKGPNSAF